MPAEEYNRQVAKLRQSNNVRLHIILRENLNIIFKKNVNLTF
jgi:hypothetical protein